MPDPFLDTDRHRHAAELARSHRAALLRYFRRKGFSAADAEDCAQEVLLRMSRRADLLSNVAHRDAYLFAIAANVAADLVRSERRRARFYHDPLDDEAHAGLDHSPEDILAGRDSLTFLDTALKELPERTRAIFVLARLEHMTQVEISRRLKIGTTTVERHIAKAMLHLAMRGCQP